MKQYKELCSKIIEQGHFKEERNGRTLALFGQILEVDLSEGFPLLTTKYINFRNIVVETLWYLLGTDKIDFLADNGVKIWNKWADENNSIGKTYGYQWRNYNSEMKDQVSDVIKQIRDGGSRRMIINGWNPLQLDEMALPPCLVLLQFHLVNRTLHLTVYQRSADMMIGVPYDIAEMALLLSMVAHVTNNRVGKVTFMYGDVHIYLDHVITYLTKQHNAIGAPQPQLKIKSIKSSIDDFSINDFLLINYFEGEKIKYEVFE